MFCPNGESISIAASTTSQNANLPPIDPETGVVRIRVGGNLLVYVNFGDSSVIADDTCMAMAADTEIFKVPNGATHIGVKSTGAGVTVYVTAGQDV